MGPAHTIVDLSGDVVELRGIPGLPGYFASACGRIYTTIARRGNVRRSGWLAQSADSRRGDMQVSVQMPCPRRGITRRTSVRVHQLVAWAWIGYPATGLVCHANGIFNDNRAANFYYGSQRDNALDREYHAEHGRGIERPGARECVDDSGLSYYPSPEYGF